MAGVRLVPKRTVDAHEAQLRAAVAAAWSSQLVKVTVTLRSHGIVLPALTAAGPAVAAARGVAVPNLWSQSEWLRNVNQHLAPVAKQVTQASVDAATATLRLPSLWGQADSADATAQAIVDRAIGLGEWIGARLDAAAVRGPAPAPQAIVAASRRTPPAPAPVPGASSGAGAAEDVVEVDMASVLGTAPDILGSIIAAMANAAATTASEDVTSYLAQYVTSIDADPYLSATKSWNNVGDDNVREAHQSVEDVSINEYFDVGGDSMLGPGDPDGSDENTINCRCWVTYDGVVPEGSGYEAGQAPQMQGENA